MSTQRKPITNVSKDRKVFSKTAKKIHPYNKTSGMRGGRRL